MNAVVQEKKALLDQIANLQVELADAQKQLAKQKTQLTKASLDRCVLEKELKGELQTLAEQIEVLEKEKLKERMAAQEQKQINERLQADIALLRSQAQQHVPMPPMPVHLQHIANFHQHMQTQFAQNQFASTRSPVSNQSHSGANHNRGPNEKFGHNRTSR